MNPPATSTIRLSLRELAQLFNSLDSSPFVDRDLATDAEEFIMSSARELPSRHELELVIVLTELTHVGNFTGVEEAVRHYFSTRAAIKRMEFRQLMRRGRLSLGVGLLFLALCLMLAELADKIGASAAVTIVKEGLTIVGWVAMWRPLEICLYDWWPLHEERLRLDRMARIRVRIVTARSFPNGVLDSEQDARSDASDAAA